MATFKFSNFIILEFLVLGTMFEVRGKGAPYD